MVIKVSYSENEVSKDSNSKTVSIQVYEDKVLYNESYSGFKAPDDKTKKFKLKEKDFEEIINKFESLGLNKNLSEIKSTEGIGINGFLKVEYYDSTKTVIHIEGKKNIWGADDYVKKNWGEKIAEKRTNIDNVEYFSKVSRFIRFIKNL